jgi:DNA-binding NtrC family response regulator/predicted hydrocarbon binding protein
MNAEDLKLEELYDFSPGRLSLSERRMVLHSINAFALFRKDLFEMVGADHSRRLLTRFGYFWGQADAAAMKRIFTWNNVLEHLKAGPQMLTLQGVCRAVVRKLEVEEPSGRFHMEVAWHDSCESEEHLFVMGQAAYPVCWVLSGYASGYCSYCLGKNVYFIEDKCEGKGDRICTATGRDELSWGDKLKPCLPYFKSDDIQGKIHSLTAELRRKTRELAAQRRLLGWGPGRAKPPFVEMRSASFRQVLELASRVALFDTSVLVNGETGSGKEVVAHFIHAQSPRSTKPFVAVNCTALPETLLESELFGHRAGSFTGASRDRIGLFEQADKGTIFLDEIGDISPAMQMKILRVLQEREILRIGDNQPRKIDVRIIAATNRNLLQSIREGRFREDLFYRLRVVEIEIPPLRQRIEDILPLARHFVQNLAVRMKMPQLRLDATCVDRLQSYPWPGNVRELENAMERAAVLSTGNVILPEHLPVTNPDHQTSAGQNPTSMTLAQVEMNHIQAVLKSAQGNQAQAARTLGISTTTLWRKLRQTPDAKPEAV